MRNSGQTLSAGFLVALTGLSGCAGVRYPKYYVLNPPAPLSGGSEKAPLLGSVAVREFEAPGILRGGPIVYKETAERLGFYEYDRWGIYPRSTVTAAVMRHLESRGLFQSVGLFDGHGSPDCLLTGAIDHLEEVDEQTGVSIEGGLSGRLIDFRTGELLWQGVSSRKTKVGQRSASGIVAGMSLEMGNGVESLISSLRDHITSTSGARSATEHFYRTSKWLV